LCEGFAALFVIYQPRKVFLPSPRGGEEFIGSMLFQANTLPLFALFPLALLFKQNVWSPTGIARGAKRLHFGEGQNPLPSKSGFAKVYPPKLHNRRASAR